MAAQSGDCNQDDNETSRTASHADESPFIKDIEHQSKDAGEPDIAENLAPENPNIVDWEKDDPENPMNWPTSKKVGVVAVVAFITMLS